MCSFGIKMNNEWICQGVTNTGSTTKLFIIGFSCLSKASRSHFVLMPYGHLLLQGRNAHLIVKTVPYLRSWPKLNYIIMLPLYWGRPGQNEIISRSAEESRDWFSANPRGSSHDITSTEAIKAFVFTVKTWSQLCQNEEMCVVSASATTKVGKHSKKKHGPMNHKHHKLIYWRRYQVKACIHKNMSKDVNH